MDMFKQYQANPNTLFISNKGERYRVADYDPRDLIYPFTLKNIQDEIDVISVTRKGKCWMDEHPSNNDIVDYDDTLPAPSTSPFDLEKAIAGAIVYNIRKARKLWILSESKLVKGHYIVQYENGELASKKLEELNNHCQMWQEPRPRVQLNLPAPIATAKAGQLVYKKGSITIIEFLFDPKKSKHCAFLAQGALFANKQDAQEWQDAMAKATRQ